MVFLIRSLKHRRQLSRRHFHLLVAGVWLYTALWLLAGYWIWIGLDWPAGYKALMELALVLGTPDVESLFMSYTKYVNEQRSDVNA